jgi:hypothetical protein
VTGSALLNMTNEADILPPDWLCLVYMDRYDMLNKVIVRHCREATPVPVARVERGAHRVTKQLTAPLRYLHCVATSRLTLSFNN